MSALKVSEKSENWMPSSFASPRTALEISPLYCNAAARSITSPPWAEPKSYQWSSSTQKEVGFLAPGRRGETVRPPFLTWIPWRDKYSTQESRDLILLISVITSYRTTVLHRCVVFAFFTAVITDIITQCVFNGWVRTLPYLKPTVGASTPRTH